MLLGMVALLALSAPQLQAAQAQEAGLHSEQARLFAAKFALQRYLSRVARRDLGGAAELVAPRARGSLSSLWERDELEVFRFGELRRVGPDGVAVEVMENLRAGPGTPASERSALYVLRGGPAGYEVAGRLLNLRAAQLTASALRRIEGSAPHGRPARPLRRPSAHAGR